MVFWFFGFGGFGVLEAFAARHFEHENQNVYLFTPVETWLIGQQMPQIHSLPITHATNKSSSKKKGRKGRKGRKRKKEKDEKEEKGEKKRMKKDEKAGK